MHRSDGFEFALGEGLHEPQATYPLAQCTTRNQRPTRGKKFKECALLPPLNSPATTCLLLVALIEGVHPGADEHAAHDVGGAHALGPLDLLQGGGDGGGLEP